MKLILGPIDRIIKYVVANGKAGSFIANNVFVIISLPKGDAFDISRRINAASREGLKGADYFRKWMPFGRGGFETRPYRDVVEDKDAVKMIGHDYKGIQDKIWIMGWKIFPTFDCNPAKC